MQNDSISFNIVLCFFNQIEIIGFDLFFVPGTSRGVDLFLELARGSQAAHLKDGILFFQNLQEI